MSHKPISFICTLFHEFIMSSCALRSLIIFDSKTQPADSYTEERLCQDEVRDSAQNRPPAQKWTEPLK